MSEFWSGWIIILTSINLVLVVWLLFANRKVTGEEGKTTGHVYDGVEEYDNALPGWWFQLFVLTLVFSAAYLVLYPGFGSFKGVLGWTQINQWEREVERVENKFAEAYQQFAGLSVDELSDNSKAKKMGQRLFANNCALCHGSDGGGAFGFPNLADGDWLYGGSPEAITASITYGRKGSMPPWGNVLDTESIDAVVQHVQNLGGNAEASEKGSQVYATYCATCHMGDGTGNLAMGAPNLADDVWLYGGDAGQIKHTVVKGRNGQMPAHKELLSEEKIHLLTAYVYGLSK
jgi:cytochrome c oxidase cbb3-type subunit 3